MATKTSNGRKAKAKRKPVQRTNDWLYELPAHPAAELFPLMADDELRDLAEDIKKKGTLTDPIVVFVDHDGNCWVLDGRNRQRACKRIDYDWAAQDVIEVREFVGRRDVESGPQGEVRIHVNGVLMTPLEFVLSKNLHRRHLTGQQKREVIAKLLKAKPEQPDRQVAAKVGSTNKTVAKVRKELEGREEIPHVEARTDSKGRSQPAARNGRAKVLDTPEAVEADARHQWLKKFGECLDWVERFVGRRDDDYLTWYTKPDSPGLFDHGITAGRINAVIDQLVRARYLTFGGKHADQEAAADEARP
jgi:ParB-like chromosome segregation protein Spo0J